MSMSVSVRRGGQVDAGQRGRWRRCAVRAAAVVVVLALTACSGTSASDGGSATPSPGGRPPATASAPVTPDLAQPAVRCGPPDAEATLVRFGAADGTGLNGVLVGTGRIGVVLVHESQPADLCGLWPFAHFLARRGMQAFAVDLRCFGRSACPAGAARGRVIDDITAAVAEMRRRGATRVAVVGASMGGAAALIAGTRVQPPLAAVVSLSGETDPTELVGGIPLNAGAVVGRLRVPAMFVVATGDRYVTVAETRTMYQAVATGDKQLLALSDGFDRRHGLELLTDPTGGRFTTVADRVATFLTAHGR